MTQPPEDEWFERLDPDDARTELHQPGDDWLTADEDRPRHSNIGIGALADPPILGLIALGLIFFVAFLAAVGVFDSGAPHATNLGQISSPASSVPTRAVTTAPSTSVSSPTPPTTTLKPGDSGTQVKALQRELTALGFAVGAIDGTYGPATSKAVAAFQRSHHLTADGIVGPATLTALAP